MPRSASDHKSCAAHGPCKTPERVVSMPVVPVMPFYVAGMSYPHMTNTHHNPISSSRESMARSRINGDNGGPFDDDYPVLRECCAGQHGKKEVK